MRSWWAVALLLGAARGNVGGAMSGARLFEDVETYADKGLHRTGTAADRSTSEWISQRLKSSGFDVEFVDFAVNPFFDYRSCELTLSGVAFPCFPVWLPSATRTLSSVPIGSAAGQVHLVELDAVSLGTAGPAIQAAIAAGAAGVVRRVPAPSHALSCGAPAPTTLSRELSLTPPPTSTSLFAAPRALHPSRASRSSCRTETCTVTTRQSR